MAGLKGLSKVCTVFMSILLAVSPLECCASDGPEYTDELSDQKGELISETSYYDQEADAQVTERLYFNGERNEGARSSSGYGTYRNEKTYTWVSGTVMTYYAQGYFVWGDGTVSVSNPSGDVYNVPSTVTVSNRSLTSGTGQYLWIFNDYAYVTFSFHTTNWAGSGSDYSVTIRISESGNNI